MLPAHRDRIRANEGQKAVAVAGRAPAKQDVGLVDAIDRSVSGNPTADEAGERQEEIHDRGRAFEEVPGLTCPGQRTMHEGPNGPLGGFAQLAPEGTRVAHVGRALVSHLAGCHALRPVVGGEDDEGIVIDAEPLQRVEDLADVVVAFHQFVAVLADARFARELLRREIGEMPIENGK